jgi:hypothetical protein
MKEKYLIAELPSSGFCNSLLELEIALSISYVTNRKLLLSDITHCHGIIPSQEWESLWDVLDKNSIQNNFNIDFIDIDIRRIQSVHEYLDKNNVSLNDRMYFQGESDSLYYHDQKIENSTEFRNFAGGRKVININSQAQYLLLGIKIGHFFYNVYPGDFRCRNELKTKINNAIKYKKEYFDIVNNLLVSKYKKYNAIHIRYPWFTRGKPPGTYQENEIDIKNRPDLLYKQIEQLYEKDLPLYISTDLYETSKSLDHDINPDEYLDQIRKNYHVITSDDLALPFTKTEKIAIDQIACSLAENFYGTYYSTFSKRINIMRGITGKKAYDYMGWDKIQDPWMELQCPYPWKILNVQWDWFYSSYLQYTFEK